MTGNRNRINYLEILAAIIVGAFGVYVAWHAGHYPMGQVSRMGPGFVPFSLGVILSIIAVALLLEVPKIERIKLNVKLRALLCVSVSIIVFAIVVRRFGLIPATICLVTISSLGEKPVRPLVIAASSIILSAASVLLFVQGLGISLPALRW